MEECNFIHLKDGHLYPFGVHIHNHTHLIIWPFLCREYMYLTEDKLSFHMVKLSYYLLSIV